MPLLQGKEVRAAYLCDSFDELSSLAHMRKECEKKQITLYTSNGRSISRVTSAALPVGAASGMRRAARATPCMH
jgi:hypothetical protein